MVDWIRLNTEGAMNWLDTVNCVDRLNIMDRVDSVMDSSAYMVGGTEIDCSNGLSLMSCMVCCSMICSMVSPMISMMCSMVCSMMVAPRTIRPGYHCGHQGDCH